jgi:hypothetical protein
LGADVDAEVSLLHHRNILQRGSWGIGRGNRRASWERPTWGESPQVGTRGWSDSLQLPRGRGGSHHHGPPTRETRQARESAWIHAVSVRP